MKEWIRRCGRWIVVLTVLIVLLAGTVTVRAENTTGRVTGFVGDIYYKNGKVQKNKAVKDQGNWYVLDGSGRMIRGRTCRLKGSSYRLREDGTAYIGAWMFGNKIYVYGPSGRLNKEKTNLLKKYCKESVNVKKKPFSKVKKSLGKAIHHWKIRGCGGKGYFEYYYYEHGFLVCTEVYGKKSYFSYAENTPWDPSLTDE